MTPPPSIDQNYQNYQNYQNESRNRTLFIRGIRIIRMNREIKQFCHLLLIIWSALMDQNYLQSSIHSNNFAPHFGLELGWHRSGLKSRKKSGLQNYLFLCQIDVVDCHFQSWELGEHFGILFLLLTLAGHLFFIKMNRFLTVAGHPLLELIIFLLLLLLGHLLPY